MVEEAMRQLRSSSFSRLQYPYMECSDEENVFVLSVAN